MNTIILFRVAVHDTKVNKNLVSSTYNKMKNDNVYYSQGALSERRYNFMIDQVSEKENVLIYFENMVFET